MGKHSPSSAFSQSLLTGALSLSLPLGLSRTRHPLPLEEGAGALLALTAERSILRKNSAQAEARAGLTQPKREPAVSPAQDMAPPAVPQPSSLHSSMGPRPSLGLDATLLLLPTSTRGHARPSEDAWKFPPDCRAIGAQDAPAPKMKRSVCRRCV